eukprot:CAMPEP_0179186910 /NCGR_PEP_ID=MMETSP0796-20121207/92721_1 /TAXON_ID=73915 /ORGANISM="Pyrodinium bahamense, Strain pbaha01" /LENGTH=285 /DNA_ID=CAMNT_0020890931 /DNA_START=22 /DNA_END=880 /DNA_ORIENTATION=+
MALAASSELEPSIEANHVEPQLVGAACPSANAGNTGLRNRSPNTSRDPDEEEEENYVQQHVPTADEQRWNLFVVLAAVADIVITGITVIVAFRFAYRANGVSLYCLGIQGVSHFISSVLLAVRFNGNALRQHRRVHLVREQILSECMGVVMLISAAALLFKAFRKIKFWDKWYLDHRDMDSEAEWATEFLAWYGFSMYVMQAVFRFIAARKLRRSILWHGFVASVVSLVFLFVLGFAASYEKEWSWKAEPIAAIALSFVTLFEGVRIIILHLDDMDTRLKFDPRA